MEAVTGARPASVAATLQGYTCFRVEGAVYPGAVAAEGAALEGVLYRGVSAPELSLLDRFEGELYDRCELRVAPRHAEPEAAFVYVVGEASRRVLTREAWSAAEFRSRHLDVYLRGCRAFRARALGEPA